MYIIAKMEKKCGRENMTGYKMTNYMVRSVNEVAMYPKVHIMFNFPISRKL
jgi:hypothetical protein